jgi:hypothetical protein
LAKAVEDDTTVNIHEESQWGCKHDTCKYPVQTPARKWAHIDQNNAIESQSVSVTYNASYNPSQVGNLSD